MNLIYSSVSLTEIEAINQSRLPDAGRDRFGGRWCAQRHLFVAQRHRPTSADNGCRNCVFGHNRTAVAQLKNRKQCHGPPSAIFQQSTEDTVLLARRKRPGPTVNNRSSSRAIHFG